MAKRSFKKLSEVNRQPRPTQPPIPKINATINTAESINPTKRARMLRIKTEDDNSTLFSSEFDENPWANLPAWG